MHLSDIPPHVAIPFAANAGAGYIRPVPVASQIGTTPGAASFTDGFPPTTFTPLTGGGFFVSGEDVNGILNFVTGWTRWQSAGGTVAFDAAFSGAIGGYPFGAVLRSTRSPSLFWVSTVDNNNTDPDGGGAANWATIGAEAASEGEITAGTIGGKYISPLGLRTQRASAEDVQEATNDTKFVTPASLRGVLGGVFGNPGFYEFPGGFLMQWGKFDFGSDANVTITFPRVFSTAIMLLPCQYQRGGGDQDNNAISGEVLTNDGWHGFCSGAGGGAPMKMNWIALGIA